MKLHGIDHIAIAVEDIEASIALFEKALDAAAKSTANLMPPILEAVSARATIGEICATLAATFGRHREGGRV